MTLIDVDPVQPPKRVTHESAVQLHLDWLDHLERAFVQVTLRSLKRALRPVTQAFGALTAAAAEPAEPAPPPVSGEAFVSPDDLAVIRTVWMEQVATQLLPLLGDVYMTGAQGVSLAVANVGDEIPEVVSIGAQEWLGVAQNRLARVGDTAWFSAREQLSEGFKAGDSVPQLAKRVQDVLDVTKARATTIARTEVIGASNAGAFAEARAMGLTQKTWLNTDDPRTRPTHVRAGDQVQPLDEPFIVGGARLMFPHDPAGPPGETINCRCTLLFDETPLCVCTPAWVRKETGSLTSAGTPDCGCSDDAPDTEAEALSVFNLGRSVMQDLGKRKGAEKAAHDAVMGYAGDDFIEINEALRFGDMDRATAKKIKDMDHAFKRGGIGLGRDITVFRGVDEEHDNLEQFTQVGAEFVDDGFMSTSIKRDVARNFSGNEGIVLEMTVRKGHKIIASPRDSPEAELILNRGTRMRVTKVLQVGDQRVVQMEVL